MATRDSYAHGTPSWVELATPDPAAARSFYGAVFGWGFEDHEPAGGESYVTCTKDGRAAAGIAPTEAAGPDDTAAWRTYVTVDDLDAAVAKVPAAGGKVVQEPVAVGDLGRMATVVDPGGATVSLWAAGTRAGAQVVNEPATLIWNELLTPDPEQVTPFYAEVLGWTVKEVPDEDDDYFVCDLPGGTDEGIAAIAEPSVEGLPTFWLPYFHVEDCDAAVATVVAQGGELVEGPDDYPTGREALVRDPQGALFSLIQHAAP